MFLTWRRVRLRDDDDERVAREDDRSRAELLLVELVGSVMFAEAKTSAGAPFLICVASVFEPPNEYVSFGAIAGKTSVSDDAA